MKKRYYLTDLDGTLLRSDATLSDYTVQVLNEALELGYFLSYATARSFASADAVTSKVNWMYPVVAYNGALLYDPQQKRVVSGRWLPVDLVDEIIFLGKRNELLPMFSGLDESDTEKAFYEPIENYRYTSFLKSKEGDQRYQMLERLKCPENFRALIITYIAPGDILASFKTKIEKLYGDRIHCHFIKDTYMKDKYFLELTHIDATKKRGLLSWAEHLGIEPGAVTVFGDNLNDMELFEKAGTRLAVANAHPELKARADKIIGANDSDGVAKYISRKNSGHG